MLPQPQRRGRLTLAADSGRMSLPLMRFTPQRDALRIILRKPRFRGILVGGLVQGSVTENGREIVGINSGKLTARQIYGFTA